jgi:hypothetical protein
MVSLNAVEHLTRFTPLTLEGQGRMFLQVKYEKVQGFFCERCNLMDHGYMECGSGEFETSELHSRPWMKKGAMWRPSTLACV